MLTELQRTLVEALGSKALSTPEVSGALGMAPSARIPSVARRLERRGLIGRRYVLAGRVAVWELTDAGRVELARLRRGELRVVDRPTHGVRSPGDDAA